MKDGIHTDAFGGKRMDHTAYPKWLLQKTEAQLRFIITDCQETLRAMPESVNSSFYADEICYCGMELKRRELVK